MRWCCSPVAEDFVWICFVWGGLGFRFVCGVVGFTLGFTYFGVFVWGFGGFWVC